MNEEFLLALALAKKFNKPFRRTSWNEDRICVLANDRIEIISIMLRDSLKYSYLYFDDYLATDWEVLFDFDWNDLKKRYYDNIN